MRFFHYTYDLWRLCAFFPFLSCPLQWIWAYLLRTSFPKINNTYLLCDINLFPFSMCNIKMSKNQIPTLFSSLSSRIWVGYSRRAQNYFPFISTEQILISMNDDLHLLIASVGRFQLSPVTAAVVKLSEHSLSRSGFFFHLTNVSRFLNMAQTNRQKLRENSVHLQT